MVQKEKNRLSLARILYLLVVLFFSIGIISCRKNDNSNIVVNYNGPATEVDNVRTIYTDSAVQRIVLHAVKQLELQNGDRTFPKGVIIDFFDEKGVKTARLTSNSGTYFKDKNFYNVKGNVIVQNLEEKKQLNTEELNWNPLTQKVDTDKFIRIETPEEIITGEGLLAAQDFSYYKIKKPIATFSLEDESEDEE